MVIVNNKTYEIYEINDLMTMFQTFSEKNIKNIFFNEKDTKILMVRFWLKILF
jgi:hypothetical protein